MTELLERALSEAAKLSAKEQDVLAAIILGEISANQRWQRAFEESAEELATLAAEALAEHLEGRTQPLDPSNL